MTSDTDTGKGLDRSGFLIWAAISVLADELDLDWTEFMDEVNETADRVMQRIEEGGQVAQPYEALRPQPRNKKEEQ